MAEGWVQGWKPGLVALLVVVGMLFAGLPRPAAAAHPAALDTAVAVSVAQAGATQPPCQPGEPHGTPCCQVNACIAFAAPAQAAHALIVPAARDLVTFTPLRPRGIAGIAPYPGLRPPRTAV